MVKKKTQQNSTKKKKPTRVSSITIEKLKKAVKDTRGLKNNIAKNLQVERTTLYNWLQKNPMGQKVIDAEKERVDDKVEDVILNAVLKEQHWPAVQFYAKTKMKNRGYVEKSEVEVSGGMANVNFSIDTKEDLVKVKEHMSKILGRKIK